MPKKSFCKYDLIIVGAGPAGIFACHELIANNSKIKIALLDMGKAVEDRNGKDIMTGFGGAGTYSDGKLHFTPKLSHERTFHLITPQKYQEILDEIDKIFIKFGLQAQEYPKNINDVQYMIDDAARHDVELVVRRSKHAGTDNLKKIITKFQIYLISNNIDFFPETEVVDIIVHDHKVEGVVLKNNEKIHAANVLLCPGRINTKWLQNISNIHGIDYLYDMVEVGVRVEFPSSVMKKYAESLYEIVFKIRTKTFDDVVRTFCSCPNGYVAVETYDGYVCVNGHSYSDNNAPNSNFAFVCEVNLTEPVENSIAYAKSIAELASTIGGGKPILQRLADLKMGRRSTWDRIKKSLVTPSLLDVTPGDITTALPYRIVKNILEGLEQLDKIMPGVNAGSTLIYAPEVKFRSSKVKTTPDMQTTIKGVYVAGDASGMAGTITGAAATGIMAARGIMKNLL